MNEKLLGDFIRKHNVRDKIFSMYIPSPLMQYDTDYNAVASKCGFKVENFTVTNSASHIKEYIEGTIERLGFTPDLYYLHRIDPSTCCAPMYSFRLADLRQTPPLRSPSQLWMRSARQARPSTSVCLSALLRRCVRPTQVSASAGISWLSNV